MSYCTQPIYALSCFRVFILILYLCLCLCLSGYLWLSLPLTHYVTPHRHPFNNLLCSGTIRKIKPYVKQVNAFFERILEGNRFTINSTDIVLMAIAILLLCLVFESHSNRAAANQRDEANRKAAAKTAKLAVQKSE